MALRLTLVLLATLFELVPSEAKQRLLLGDFWIEYVQMNDAGEQIEHAIWRCSTTEMLLKRCDQGIMVAIDGRPQPIDIRIHLEGDIVQIAAARGRWKLAVKTGKRSLELGKWGFVSASVEIWDTMNIRDDLASEFVNDGVMHPPFRKLGDLQFLVQRLPLGREMPDLP